MPVVLNNNFSNDTYGVRTERLIAIQGNLASIQSELQVPANILTWSEDCNDVFSNLLAVSQLEINESEGATAIVTEKELAMEEIYQNVKTMGIAIYKDLPEYLKDYGFENAFPIRRDDKFRAVDTVLLAFARHKAAAVTPLIPELMITRLTAARDAFKAAIEVQDKERSDARHSVAELSKRFESDTAILNQLKSWWYVMLGKKDPRITLIGMVNPQPGGGGKKLEAPKNFRFFRGSRVFAWDLVENATRYEVEMSLDQIEWIQVFYDSWNEIEVDVPDGFSYYRCRAHNSGGFGDFCEVLEIEYYRVLPAPLNFRLELIEGTPKKARCLCDAVPTAELYMTYVSVVNIGASPGEWTGAASNELPEVLNELVLGKRNYFSMQAQNEGQSSLKTDALYLDVVD